MKTLILRILASLNARFRAATGLGASPTVDIENEASARPAPVQRTPYFQRVDRLQRHDDAYLGAYWDAYSQERFEKLTETLRSISNARANHNERLRVLDFGCGAGALFRAMREGGIDADMVGVDVDFRALSYLHGQLPEASTIDADIPRFSYSGIADTESFDACVSTSVLLLVPDEEMQLALKLMSAMSNTLVIVDQIENTNDEADRLLTLSDHAGVEYDAVCHRFEPMLNELGFDDVTSTKLDAPVKGATGILVARRDESSPAASASSSIGAYRQRVERLQRPDDGYLLHYWDSYEQRRFLEYSAAVAALMEGRDRVVSVFDFACGAGQLFRALSENLGDRFSFRFAGADADRNAIQFLRREIPATLAFEADPDRLRDLQFSAGEHFDICFATSLFYALDANSVLTLIAELASLTDTIIIGDQIENADGDEAKTMSLVDHTGAEYEAYCHPFKAILAKFGYSSIAIVPIEQPEKSITGLIIGRRDGTLPEDLVEDIRQRATYRHFGTERQTEARVEVFGARDQFDTSTSQLETPPEIDHQHSGSLYVGPELIADHGIKVVGVSQPDSLFQIELETADGTIWTEKMNGDRQPLSLEQTSFSPEQVFPTSTTPVDENWERFQWGSWGELSINDDALMLELTARQDVDANQADGMGPLDLLFYTHPDADLRDATVELQIRGIDFEPNDSEVYLWLQNRISSDNFKQRYGGNAEAFRTVSANYALTSHPLTEALADGAWHTLQIPLRNDPTAWSFAGNVFADGRVAVRYSYMPLDDVLSNVANFHILACFPRHVPNVVDKRDLSRFGKRATGRIELKQISFTRTPSAPSYRNADIVLPDGIKEGRYRYHVESPGGAIETGSWVDFTLPSSRYPQVSSLQLESDESLAGRINAMGYRTWARFGGGQGEELYRYLGATLHGRDMRFRLDGGDFTFVDFVNEFGSQRFDFEQLTSRPS